MYTANIKNQYIINIDPKIIISINNHHTLRLHILDHFRLCPEDPFPAPQIFKMRITDYRKDTNIRLCHLCETGHFLKMRDAHFDHSHIVLWFDTKNSQRHSQFIIKIGFCLQHLKPGIQNGRDHFLRRSLTDASRDTDHRDRQRVPVPSGKFLQCLLNIFHDDHWPSLPIRHAVPDATGRSAFKRLTDIVVTIHFFSGESGEHGVFLNFTAVDDHRAYDSISITVQLPFHNICDL